MTGNALIPVETSRSTPGIDRRDAARIYAATQSRRTAPVAMPTKGRIVDLAG